MCAGDDHTCPQFELHRQKLLDDLDAERRSFLKSAFAAGGGAAAAWAATGGTLISPAAAQSTAPQPGRPTYHYLPATADTVHWGYFSKLLKPQLEVDSGDYVTIEALTHHANDDAERMVKGDPGAESVFLWTKEKKGVNRRGAGPVDGKLLGRGAGEGFGVHICTGPVFVRGAEPGDILEVRIIDVKPRPCANPAYAGKAFGSNAAAWWGFHYKELLTEPKPREVMHHLRDRRLRAAQLGPGGLQFPLDAADRSVRRGAQDDRLSGRAGRPHHRAGEPRHPQERADSDPTAFRRNGPSPPRRRTSSTRSRPVISAATWTTGASARARPCTIRSRCRARCSRSAIPTPRRAIRNCAAPPSSARSPAPSSSCCTRRTTLTDSLAGLDYPLLETQDEWVLHGFSFANYLAELGPNAQQDIYTKSSIDLALKDAFRKMRAFLMTTKGLTEDEAISLISVAVDFGVTQVVDGNWGIHAIVKKSLFAGASA